MKIRFLLCALFVFFQTANFFAQEITDVQGIVSVKAPTDSRWSLARSSGRSLHEGDRVRTGPRGANAVRLVYENGNTAVLGPDSILEIGKGKGNRIQLLKGELELSPATKKRKMRFAFCLPIKK